MTDLDEPSSLPPSLRTVGDSWAITELVGATALARLGRPVPEDLTGEAVRSTLLWAHLGSIQGAKK